MRSLICKIFLFALILCCEVNGEKNRIRFSAQKESKKSNLQPLSSSLSNNKEGASVISSTFNLAKSIIGAGVL